jgi:hypothetical protein
MRTFLAFLLSCVAFITAPANAEDPEQFTYKWYKRDLYWQRYFCGGEYRPNGCERHWRWRPARYYSHRWRYTQPSRCKLNVRVIGSEANTKSGAQVYGERSWFIAVRHDYGVKYSNLDRAKDVRIICDPSTITQFAKRVLWICVVSAVPCEASMTDAVKAGKRFGGDDIEVRD